MPKVTEAYLAGLTVVELKALAAELGVVVAGIQRKRELQARILAEKDGEEARAEDADDGDSDEDEDDSDEAEGEAPARAALPANRKPVWRTPPPPTASEAASSFNWLRDPWLFYDTAHREWGPETFRARAAKREAEERFARIRKLTPKIEDALVQEVIDDEIRALIKRKLDQRAVQAVEKKARWADYPSDIRELVEDVDKEVDRQRKETKKTQASRGSGKGAPPAGGQASGPRDDRRTRRGRPLKEIAHIPGAKVQRALLDIIDAAYADSTWQNIAYTHAKWRRYVRKVDLLGATVADQVLSWIGWMQADGLKASSILTEMGNVTAALKLQGVTLEDPRLRMVLKGLAKMKVEQPRDQARPISKRLMWDVVQRAPPKAAAVFAIAWLTCSRIGDVRRTPASDVTLKGELMELSWRQRKDWRNIGVVTTVRTGPWREFVERHLRLLAPTDTLGGDWTTARFASLLPKTYSGHSIRRGAAQFALKHASAESVRTLTLHATLTGLIRRGDRRRREGTVNERSTLTRRDDPAPAVRDVLAAANFSLSDAVLSWDPTTFQAVKRLRDPAPPTARIAQKAPSRLRYDRCDRIAGVIGHRRWMDDSRWVRDHDFFYRFFGPFKGRSVLTRKPDLHPGHARDVAMSSVTRKVAHASPIVEMKVFTIAKKGRTDEGRLICWPETLNGHLPREQIPATSLPSREEIWDTVRSANVGLEVDALSFFHAFELDPRIRPCFGMRLPHGKFQMEVMPMGWNVSMAVATSFSDMVSSYVTTNCASGRVTPWVDNFFLSARDKSGMAELWDAWTRTAEYVGLETKPVQQGPAERVQWLGLDVDLPSNRIRAPRSVTTALGPAIDAVSGGSSFRDIYRVLGVCNFYLYFLGMDGWDFPVLSLFQSRVGRLLHERPALWDSPYTPWPSLVSTLRRLRRAIAGWKRIPQAEQHRLCELWTDASTTGWGALSRGLFSSWGAWTPLEAKHPIHRLEALALLTGVEKLLRRVRSPVSIRAFVDNSICVYAFKRGRCKDPLTARILRRVKRAARLQGSSIELRLVSTKEQLADALSRQVAGGELPCGGVRYAMLALGDQNYDRFCNGGKVVEELLKKAGAKPFCESGYADDGVGLEAVVEPWRQLLPGKVKEAI
ncbi:putative methionine synthase reductase [Diplonema papillatum]|nr:putative methionine synthase reductase [Diplonema papillatum]